MKKVRLNDLEDSKNNILKQYKLDKDSIDVFRSKIRKVSEKTSESLSIDLFHFLICTDFHDDYETIIKLFIYDGANVNFCDASLLNLCCTKQYNKTIIALIRAGINIHCKDNSNYTPLMKCAEVGNKEILELLILMGVDVNLKNDDGETALSLALKNNHKECADILINAQSHLNSNDLNINVNHSSVDDQFMSLIKEAEDKFCAIENISKSFDDCKMDLLTDEQISYQIDFFEKYGCSAAITDFAILLGGFVSAYDYTREGNNNTNRTGWWWTRIPFKIVGASGILGTCYFLNSHSGGIRPILPFSYILTDCSFVDNKFDIKEAIFGEYPQYLADLQTAKTLELNYKVNCLNETGKNYTINYIKFSDNNKVNNFRTLKEYEYDGKKYIRFVGDSNNNSSLLSDGRHICVYSPYWIKVEPISWFVDEKNDIAVSKRLLTSGIPFRSTFNHKTDYENSDIYIFLNEYMIKDIIPSKINNKQLIKK